MDMQTRAMSPQESGIISRGIFTLECFNRNTGEKRWEESTRNMVVTEGLNLLLNAVLYAGSTANVTTWYAALVNTNTAAASTMTYATPAYTEFTTYTEANRPTYVAASSAAGSITNSASKATFTIDGTTTLYGASIVSSNVKGDTASAGAYLFCYALLSTSRAVVSTDVVNLTYTISAS